ncbi:hypothetical protein NM96037_1652 [Neisseria meningitidis 96037]|nr:hypothetical protein NM96037_1652 [Neisseria meningitidis 96037]
MNRHSRTLRHSRKSGNLERRVEETVLSDKFPCRQVWIPALYDALYQRGALIFLTFPFDSQVKGAFLCQQ